LRTRRGDERRKRNAFLATRLRKPLSLLSLCGRGQLHTLLPSLNSYAGFRSKVISWRFAGLAESRPSVRGWAQWQRCLSPEGNRAVFSNGAKYVLELLFVEKPIGNSQPPRRRFRVVRVNLIQESEKLRVRIGPCVLVRSTRPHRTSNVREIQHSCGLAGGTRTNGRTNLWRTQS